MNGEGLQGRRVGWRESIGLAHGLRACEGHGDEKNCGRRKVREGGCVAGGGWWKRVGGWRGGV